MNKKILTLLLLLALLFVVAGSIYLTKKQTPPSETTIFQDFAEYSQGRATESREQDLQSQEQKDWISRDFSDFGNVFEFRASYPKNWRIEENKEASIINLFDPKSGEEKSINQSQIFVSVYRADDFSVQPKEDSPRIDLAGHSAIYYQVDDSQLLESENAPDWTNREHFVLQIRNSPASPSAFFVLQKNPTLSEEIFLQFATSIVFYNNQRVLFPPLADWKARISKKPFGIKVSPQNSPVQPEIFSGFHTGTDFEIKTEEANDQIPVHAVCHGEIIKRDTVSGYGGTIVQKCHLEKQPLTIVYGHLSFDSEFAKEEGFYLTAGQIFATLADDKSTQSGGERKHLHLTVRHGDEIDLRGYVENEKELENWLDPEKLFQK